MHPERIFESTKPRYNANCAAFVTSLFETVLPFSFGVWLPCYCSLLHKVFECIVILIYIFLNLQSHRVRTLGDRGIIVASNTSALPEQLWWQRVHLNMGFLEELYEESLQPFRKDGGTPYPTSQADIDFHQASKSESTKGPSMSRMEATAQIMRHNSENRKLPLPPKEQAAIDNLLDMILDVEDGYRWGPDLAIKCFRDLDLVFFGGHLQGHVCVSWQSLASKWPARILGMQALGVTLLGWGGKTKIFLDRDIIFKDRRYNSPFVLMFETLLHEMVHAYDLVVCPWWKPDKPHGQHFQTSISVVHDRAVRLLNIPAIALTEPYRQHHFFADDIGKHLYCGRDSEGQTGQCWADSDRWKAVHVVGGRNGGNHKRPPTRKRDETRHRKTDGRQCVVM